VGFEALDAVELPAVEAPRQPADDDDLHQALGRLKRSERELLYLAIVESYTATEIAEITGRPRGTVLSTLHRSKQKLRDLLTRGEKGIVS
jgi:RNA polymerase sigma-70 factor (ECF subfamily)